MELLMAPAAARQHANTTDLIESRTHWLVTHAAVQMLPEVAQMQAWTAGRGLLPVAGLTRRTFVLGALATAALAACGRGDDDEDANATRPFVDSTGQTVQIPVRPQRIIATHDYNAAAQVLALGGPLVGMATRDGKFEEGVSRFFDLGDVKPVGEYGEPDVELVTQLAPDLIVCEAWQGEIYAGDHLDRLRELAPVVGMDTFRPVGEVMSHFSELLGESATISLDQLRDAYADVIEEIRALLGDGWRDVTASHVQIHNTSRLLQAWGPTAIPPTVIMNDLGVSWAPAILEAGNDVNNGYLGNISLERMHEFSGDIITADLSLVPETVDDPFFKLLPAAQAGQVVGLRDMAYGTHYPNFVAIAQDILEQLKAMQPIRTDLV